MANVWIAEILSENTFFALTSFSIVVRSFMILRLILSALFVAACISLPAQVKQREEFGKEGQFTFETDKPYKLLELDEATSEPIVTKKKKPKKKTFYGIKTKKGFTRKGFGEKMVLELFFYTKKKVEPTKFVRDIWWYDFNRREIRKTGYDPNKGQLLHGPYKRMQGEVVLEEGIYYKGAKHGRWMKYDRQNLLEDKDKFYKGWPKESIVTYYDPVEKTKVKEMIPVEYNEREGFYTMFHENGTLAVQGEYKWNEKVGEWVENYPNGKRKKIVAYPKEPFDKEVRPFVKREWDLKGKEIYSAKP
jgi:antitoxin component YwqK of YwqJK toxin-antitoxin module